MKIGILTLPLHTNYGGILQAYALQTMLERMGHEAFILVREENVFKRIIKNNFYWVFSFLQNIKNKKNVKDDRRLFKSFIKREIHYLYFKDEDYLKKENISTIVVGSDQVWRYKYSQNNILYYFLNFIGDTISKVSYAASFGIDDWDYPEAITKECRDLACKFKAISVREQSAIDLCKVHLGIVPELVLDPTMLLSKADYACLSNNLCLKHHKCISYILDQDEYKQNILYSISKKLKCQIYPINDRSNINSICLPSPDEWVANIANTEFVVTDSFHGTAFAINFNKDFIVLDNIGRGQTRLLSILKLFGLENRLCKSLEDAMEILKVPIDWERVNETMKMQRGKAISFLKNNL